MPNDSKLNFTYDQLMEGPKVDALLIVGGVRCHGGFDGQGQYSSPRTKWRNPAVKAWQEQHIRDSGLPLLEIPQDCIPAHLPSVEQAKLLIRQGIREPMVRTLTEIAIIEGFGATIRELPIPFLKTFVAEDCDGTALKHLGNGLFEAHARDEAGWGEEGGHKQMWEAARDAAFSNPKVPSDVLMAIMSRRAGRDSRRPFPQLNESVERLIGFMMQVLIVEVFAMETFRWAEEVLSDPAVSDAPVDAANLVRYIRSDESPHVEYLRTALSELTSRTLIGEDGSRMPGSDVVNGLLDRSMRFIMKQRIQERRTQLHDSIRRSANGTKDIEELLARFDALETPWQPPERYRSSNAENTSGSVSTYA